VTARVFGALVLAAGIFAIPWVSAEAAPAVSRCGSAAWFADSDGLTASGERNEAGALSAAHRSLPFGTEVEVENLANGHSVVVRVNDRGPFTGSRIISVSSAAADQLDMKREGIAKVRLTLLNEDNPPGDACGAVAGYVEAGGDLPDDEPATTLPAAVVSYTESDMDPGGIESGMATETAAVPDAADDRIAERFVVAFQTESARNLPLKNALGAAALFAAPPYAKWPAPVEPFSSGMLLFSATGANSWPIFDGKPASDLSSTALAAP
jgi:rare lipoprotein A